jgi:hypothetical protein
MKDYLKIVAEDGRVTEVTKVPERHEFYMRRYGGNHKKSSSIWQDWASVLKSIAKYKG